MFEEATRLKLRFNTGLGNLAVEDLWDLPLLGEKASLDSIAKWLNKAIKEESEESFVVKKTIANAVLNLKFEIVKHIIDVKLEEAERREKAAETKAKKERIMAILEEKQDDDLKSKSADELKDLLKDF